mgnify:CR=1 FL=1
MLYLHGDTEPVVIPYFHSPTVQNGHVSPGLMVERLTTKPTNCIAHMCYETTISLIATYVGMFRYCVQTTDRDR